MAQEPVSPLIQKGWAELVKDHDDRAFGYFYQAYEKAVRDKDVATKAESLLDLGICSYGASREKGLAYAMRALSAYQTLETANTEAATTGRAKCLQLIATIYIRQGKYPEALKMEHEVVALLKSRNDSSGTLGLAYSALGSLHDRQQRKDSAALYARLALNDFQKSKNYAYVPNAYVKIGEISLANHQYDTSLATFAKGLRIADSTGNRQAQVSCLTAIGKWHLAKGNANEAEKYYRKANGIAMGLSDKLFEMKTLEALIALKKQQQDFAEASQLQQQLLILKDTFYSLEREQIVKNLEVQFDVSEKDRKLALLSKEQEVTQLTNYLLVAGIVVLAILFSGFYFSLRSISRRERLLLKVRSALVEALEKQQELRELQYASDLEHKEAQLGAITLQMLEKNELLSEIKAAIEKQDQPAGAPLLRMVDRHLAQDSRWQDFDRHFESVNKNFYTRLKASYPDISANDLKICALIRLNLSIKEMASVMNISPDSVKTARYRLRKKLQLPTEENLTAFILSI
ncbi:MAG TPA: tetratricopeptide repeat protein [Flavobacterium sp.]|nr:tetratricopeptide repeat protein [Flavobacterium sp.]